MASNHRAPAPAVAKVHLQSLPTDAGGSIVSFLFAQEQCVLMRTSKRFRSYAKSGLRMKRHRLVVLTPTNRAPMLEILDKLATRCPHSGLICQLFVWSSSGRLFDCTETPQYGPVLCDCRASSSEPQRTTVDLSRLSTLPCAKHLQELGISIHEKVRQSCANIFEALKLLRITTSTNEDLKLVKNTWCHVPSVCLTFLSLCTSLSATLNSVEVGTFKEWKNLRELQLRVKVGGIPLVEEEDAVRELYESIRPDIAKLKVTKLIRITYGVSSANGDVDNFVKYTGEIVAERFPQRLTSVKCERFCDFHELVVFVE